jgi:hypothetical protein
MLGHFAGFAKSCLAAPSHHAARHTPSTTYAVHDKAVHDKAVHDKRIL